MTALYAMQLDRVQTVAHLAYVNPPEVEGAMDKRGVATWPEGERKYLCGRAAQDIHSRSFRWTPANEWPTCKRCRRAVLSEALPEADQA